MLGLDNIASLLEPNRWLIDMINTICINIVFMYWFISIIIDNKVLEGISILTYSIIVIYS